MSLNLTVTEANRLLDAVNGTTPYTAPTGPIKIRAMTANGDHSTAGTEVVGGSYASQTITSAGAASGVALSNLLARFNGMPAAVVAGIEIWDSTPRRMWWGALPQIGYAVVAATDVFTSAAHGMAAGDPVQFLTGQNPTGLTANTTYYVISPATNTYQLSATVAGSTVNVTADGSGTVIKCAAVTAGNALEIPVGQLSTSIL